MPTSDQEHDRQECDLLEHAQRAGYKVAGVFKETLSGISNSSGKQPVERGWVTALAQRREFGVVLVTDLTRRGRSTQNLMGTIGELASYSGLQYGWSGLIMGAWTPTPKT